MHRRFGELDEDVSHNQPFSLMSARDENEGWKWRMNWHATLSQESQASYSNDLNIYKQTLINEPGQTGGAQQAMPG